MNLRTRTVVLVSTGALVLAGAFALALWPTAKRGAFSEVLSTHRADSLGAKALFEVFALTGRAPRRHTDDLTALPAGGVVFLLNPEAPKPLLEGLPRGPTFSEAERRALLHFVEAGGRVVVVANRQSALHRDFGLRIVDEPLDEKARASAAKERRARAHGGDPGLLGALSRGAAHPKLRATGAGPGTLTATGHARGSAKRLSARRIHHFDVPAHDARAAFIHDGSAVVATLRRGRGEAVFVAAPSLAGNALLAEADNLLFWSDLATPPVAAAGAELRFDEYHHGHRTPRGLVALAAATDLHFVLWQLALAGVLLLWAGLRRLPPRHASPLRQGSDGRGAEESLAAMASLYERGRLGRHAADRIGEWLERALAARLHLRGERTHDLAAVLRQRGRPELAADFTSLQARGRALAERPRPRDLLAFARAAAALRRAADDAFAPRSTMAARSAIATPPVPETATASAT